MPHLRGGILQAMLRDWTAHMVQIGNNDSGLGCQSFIELQGKEDKCYIILSGYQVCKNQAINPGSSTHSTNNIDCYTKKDIKIQTCIPNL